MATVAPKTACARAVPSFSLVAPLFACFCLCLALPASAASGSAIMVRADDQDAAQGRALAAFARGQLKAGSAAIVTNRSRQSSIALARHFGMRFRESGGVAWEQATLPGPRAHAALIERILALAPDVVLFAGDARDSGLLMQSLRGRGARAVFLGGDGWGMRIPSYAGAGAEGSYRAAHWQREHPHQASPSLPAQGERRFGPIGAESASLADDAVQPVAIVQWRGGHERFVTAITPP